MKYKNLIIEKREYVYLKRILNISGYTGDFETQKSLKRLLDELKTAQIVDNDELPKDVIRLNSKVSIEAENGWKKTLQIVIPADRDLKNDKISVLTPMGAALIGYSQSDAITWEFSKGEQKLTIVAVAQDETYEAINI
ncbi:GreA/GreB family elongation factor [Cellulophaga sp. Hel_I_12]|uniref:GreA/GreB family elongation factor n=1 Tax=Cellulophaga sp. Hel_I_12 TaxID=1249972 RepID=UPI0006476730|nr:GreA/GreB family elongation factor [Cellulophaga sp. Hel_I_12]